MPDAPYVLDQRVISEEDAADLVHGFSCGDDFWARDVDNFLQFDAWPYQQRGNCTTRLFSFPGDKAIVGFMTRAAASVDKELLRPAMPHSKRERPSLPFVPVVRALYMGIHKDLQKTGFAKELNARFLRNVQESFFRPRYVMLEVYAENPIRKSFAQRGYVELDHKSRTPRGLVEEKELVIMGLDLERDTP